MSKSTAHTRKPRSASPIARLADVVVLPTPPLPEVTHTTVPPSARSCCGGMSAGAVDCWRQQARAAGLLGVCKALLRRPVVHLLRIAAIFERRSEPERAGASRIIVTKIVFC